MKIAAYPLTLAALLLSAVGCSLLEQNEYSVYRNEFGRGAYSAAAQGNAGAQVPIYAAANPGAGQTGAVSVPVEGGTVAAPAGQLTMAGTYSRSAEIDMSAAMQMLQDLKNSTTGQTPTSAQRQSTTEATSAQTSTTDDRDTVTPTISTAVSGQGTASAPASTPSP